MPGLFEPKAITWPGETDLRDNLLSYIKKYSDAGKNTGENLTPYERTALEQLGLYTGGGASPTSQAAEAEMLKTLRGEYNPETSAYYRPVIQGIEARRDAARDRLRRSSQLGGNLTSLSRVTAEANSDTEYEAQIAQMMLGLQQDERNRMLGVIPQALQYGQYVEEGPLRKAEANRTIGSIPRDLETGAINTGSGILTNYKPSYYFEPTDDYMNQVTKKSKFNWGGLAGAGLGLLATGGNPSGATAGYQAGSAFQGYFG